MTSQLHDNKEWKKVLSKRAHRVLRERVLEAPGTGEYVRVQSVGTYLCRGCTAPLFSSSNKIDDGSGFATFTKPSTEAAVSIVAHYSESGDVSSGIVCTTCGGYVGFMDAMTMQSALDLEQGTLTRYYHVSSDAVTLKKAVSARNYPISFALGILFVCVAGYYGWRWGTTLLDVSNLARTDATIPLWIDDREVRAVVVHLDQPQASTSGMVIRQDEVLFFVLGIDGIPGIRFTNHSVDVLWLDENFKVVGWERERASQSPQVLTRPPGARYGLISQPGAIPPKAFATGFEVIVTDRSALF
jgi:peptide methionine sulfoxide reductase MsrB